MKEQEWGSEFDEKFGVFGGRGLGRKEEVKTYVISLLASQKQQILDILEVVNGEFQESAEEYMEGAVVDNAICKIKSKIGEI